jgi:hypothetical protein
MGKARRDVNLIDWTFSEAPEADEPPAGPEWPQPRPVPVSGPRLPMLAPRLQLTWLVPGFLTVLALAVTAAMPSFQGWLVRRAVESQVAQQEQARLAGDWSALRGTFDEPAGDWTNQQIEHLRSSWQAAAFGLPGAHLTGAAGQVHDYQLLTPQLARVEVVRRFSLYDGTPVRFGLPQFYRFAGGAWRQTAPPREPAGDPRALHRSLVDVHYSAADAPLAAHVADDLQLLVTQACADWVCPADLSVAVIFGSPDPVSRVDSERTDALPGSLLYRMLAAGQPQLPALVVKLPTREWAGYPADSAALSAVQRAVAVQVVANIGERLSGGAPALAGPVWPLRYALIARELARLGVEPPSLLTLDLVAPPAEFSQLWAIDSPAAWRALPAALATVDGLLVDRPLADERRLLCWLPLAPDMTSWVAAGLELTPEQARAQLAQE